MFTMNQHLSNTNACQMLVLMKNVFEQQNKNTNVQKPSPKCDSIDMKFTIPGKNRLVVRSESSTLIDGNQRIRWRRTFESR